MLKLSAVETYYSRTRVLKKISLEVAEGEIISIIGANGAGKSTTLKTISGLLRPTSESRIEFLGRRVDGLPSYEILKMGIAHVPEGRRIFQPLSVIDNLLMGAHIFNDSKKVQKNLESLFEYFPILRERRQQLAGTLSGGEQQMLAIARGLMSEPKILLLDEPSLGLAPLLVKKVAEIIKAINGRGLSILLIEQNVFMALGISERGYVLETGSVVLSDRSKNLLNNDMVRKSYLGL